MILTDKIKVKISKMNINHFRNIGMDINLKDVIEINPSLLNKGSHTKIKVKCDVCGKEKEIMFENASESNKDFIIAEKKRW